MNTTAIRLRPGADLKKAVEEFAQHHHVLAGYIATAVGSLDAVSLRLAGARDKWDSVGEFEVVSLQGTFSIDGCHIHISVSDDKGTVTGGHLSYGCVVRTTCELVLVSDLGVRFRRVQDKGTGFAELSVEPDPDNQ